MSDTQFEWGACDLNQFAYDALGSNSNINHIKLAESDKYPAQDAYKVSFADEETPMYLLVDSQIIRFGKKYFNMGRDTRVALRRYNRKFKLKQWWEKNRAVVWTGIGVAAVAILMSIGTQGDKRKEESRNVEPTEKTVSKYLAAKQGTVQFSNNLQKGSK